MWPSSRPLDGGEGTTNHSHPETPPHSHPPPSTHEHPVHWLLLLLRVAAQGAGRGCVRYLRSGMLGEPADWQSTASSPIFQLRRKAMFTGTENLLLRTL